MTFNKKPVSDKNIQAEKTSQEDNVLTLASLFRNGNDLTLEYSKLGIIPTERFQAPRLLTKEEQRQIRKGTRRNSPEENMLLSDVIKSLSVQDGDIFQRYGLNFKKINGSWVQDTVKITGGFLAKQGTIIMGNIILNNVIFSSSTTQIGNAFDKNHHVPYIELNGKIF